MSVGEGILLRRCAMETLEEDTNRSSHSVILVLGFNPSMTRGSKHKPFNDSDRPSHQLIIQIAPIRIEALDQLDLPLPIPAL